MGEGRIQALPQRRPPSKLAAYDKSRLQLAKPPSPFLDYASTILPSRLHDVWRWCAYFAIFNPLINAAIVRKSLYSVTDFSLRGGLRDSEIDDWMELLDEILDIQSLRVQLNLDLYVFGHAALSVLPPFKKYFICTKCGRPYLSEIARFKVDSWSKTFKVHCKKCKGYQKAKVVDWYVKHPKSRITLRRWDPFELSVRRVGMGLRPKYELEFSKEFKNHIKMGKREAISDTPQEFVEAILHNKKMEVYEDKIFVLEETALSPSNFSKSVQTDEGWPWPSLAACLPDAFHLKVALKGEEALILTQLIPFRMITPAGSGDTASSVQLAGAAKAWMSKIEEMVKAWEQDPASIAASPIPSQLLQFGNPSMIMLPEQSVRLLMERILIGTRTPPEFVWGGKSWSGASHSLRALDNEFEKTMALHERLIRFIMRRCAAILGWSMPDEIFLQPTMSSDEVQKLSLMNGMASQGGMSYRIIHERMGLNSDAVFDSILDEQKKRLKQQAELTRMQGELGLTPPAPPGQPPGAPAQGPGGAPGQGPPPGGPPPEGGPPPGAPMEGEPPPEEMPPEGLPPEATDQLSGSHGTMTDQDMLAMTPMSGVDPNAVFQIVEGMKFQNPLQRAMTLQNIFQKNPDMHEAIRLEFNPMSPTIDQPLPEQLPPRRAGQGGY